MSTTTVESHKATSIAWRDTPDDDGSSVSRTRAAYEEQRMVESHARPHAQTQREEVAKAKRDR
jgi:hypothetical protein